MFESSDAGDVLEARWLPWVIGFFALTICLTTNLPWHLDDYDQAKQAFTSYEMVKQGHWFYQHTSRERLATKPPLVGWISAALFEVTRSWDVAWRLPSLLSAAAIAFLIARNAREAFGCATAVVGVSAFVFNFLTPRLATLVRTDMPLALIVCSVGFLIWRHIHWSRPWETRERWLVFLLLTAGTLIKGPIVYVFLLPGLLLLQFWKRKTDSHAEWPGWWPWIASLLVFLVWVAGGIRFVPDFYEQVVRHEFLGRFGETEHQAKPIYFYLPHLLARDFPWSVLILAFAWALWRVPRTRDARVTVNPGLMWIVCWVIGALIIMSLIPSKRVDRIFPLIPPLALLLSAEIALFSPNVRRGLYVRPLLGALFVAVLAAAVYTGSKISSSFRAHDDTLVQFGRRVQNQSAEKHWRYSVIYGGDEGMLMYLDKVSFSDQAAAISDWNAAKLEALVVPARDLEAFRKNLRPSGVVSLRTASRGADKPDYALLSRE